MAKRKKSRAAPTFAGLRPSSAAASKAKRANKKTDSIHEVILRRELRKLGLRFRTYAPQIVGNPDLIVSRARVVIFCDGDFWHGRHWRRLRQDLLNRHNAEYWIAKIANNRKRDREVNRRLRAL